MTFAHTLGVHHRTAWAMLQHFAVAMVRAERELVSGDVEGEETFVGGVDVPVSSRYPEVGPRRWLAVARRSRSRVGAGKRPVRRRRSVRSKV